MKQLSILVAVLWAAMCLVQAAPVPDEVLKAVDVVATSNGLHPRQPHYLLEQFVPVATGDKEQCQQLARVLLGAFSSKETTAAGRTIIAQHLSKVAGADEIMALKKMQGDETMMAEIRIALNQVALSSLQDEGKDFYLNELKSDIPARQIAGLAGIAKYHPAAVAKIAVQYINHPDPKVSSTALRLLARSKPSVFAESMAALPESGQINALQIAGEHGVLEAGAIAAKMLASPDNKIKDAALVALGTIGNAKSVAALAAAGALESLTKLTAKGVDEAILKVISSGSDLARTTAIQAAEARDIPQRDPALLKAAAGTDKVAAEAIKVLGRSGNISVYSELTALLGGALSEDTEFAVRRMIKRMDATQDPLKPLLQILDKPGVVENTRIAVLRSLSAVGGDVAINVISKNMGSDSEVVKDAALRALAGWPDLAAVPLIQKVIADQNSSLVHRTLCERALARLEASGVRLSALAAINCGVDNQAQGKSGVAIKIMQGQTWKYSDEPAGTVAYDGNAVVVEVSGLDPTKKYQVGFVWWDYDNNGRVQSVQVGNMQVLDKTPLPAWKDKQQPAVALAVNIPPSEIKDGKAVIRFKREGANNCVVSEMWVAEGELSDAPAPIAVAAIAAAPQAKTPAKPDPKKFGPPVVKANQGATKKVLVVTGLEYPGHPWRETAPEIVKLLAADKRLEVSYTEDYTILAREEIFDYQALFLNYQNHGEPGPEGALENLSAYILGGGGMTLFHFACGAFIGYPQQVYNPEFMKVAGRSWNPKLRGHDPFGKFTVTIADDAHPITEGIKDFEQEDELYTCLDGDMPIHVLASAVSKVDKKVYPIALLYTPEKGRVFNCVLGHNVKGFNDSSNELYRRGTAWAAGL